MTYLSERSKPDFKIVALGIILSCGVVYSIYSTVRHFYALNQINEAKDPSLKRVTKADQY